MTYGDPTTAQFLLYRNSGDTEALAQVFEQTSARVRQIALKLSRDAATADDVVQTTYLIAMQASARFDGRNRITAWLVGIAERVAHNLNRANRRSVDWSRMTDRRGFAGEATAEIAQRAELLARVECALSKLSEPYREVIQLHLNDGLRPVEIARQLGRCTSTIRNQLARGLVQLRGRFERCQPR